MGKTKESINSRISSKKYWRTFEQQSYRDKLARTLKEKRKEWDKEEMNRKLIHEMNGAENGGEYFKSMQTLHGRKPTNALAKKLIKEYWIEWIKIVYNNLSEFSWLDKDIWIKIACFEFQGSTPRRWCWIASVMEHIDKFQWLDVNVLINEYVKRSKEYLKKYYDDRIRNSWIKELCSWISKYKWSNINKETAKMLIHNWASACITDYNHIDKFEWLDKEISNLLTEKGNWKFVKAHPEKFWLKKKKKWIK